jgi:PTH1 family peptidyl-tRNA hydrolase
MKYIIGLGNPSKKYKNTRHNIGQDTVFKLINSLDGDFLTLNKTQLINPECYMNGSGLALKKLFKNVKPDSDNENILIIHDDLDQPIGKMKMIYGGNSGGHNGIKSVHSNMKIKNFYRLKVGISPQIKVDKDKAPDFVLGKFTPDEKEIMKKLYPKILEGIKLFMEGEVDRAVEVVNRK